MTASSHIEIRTAEANDFAQWNALWQDYLCFCGAELADDITALTWQRILDPTPSIQALLAIVDDRVAGFAVHVLHEGTWTRTPICYLEDLFVGKQHRGLGVGRALLTHLVDHAKTSGWSRLYWHTKNDNAVARHLYNSFTEADTLVRYQMTLSEDNN